MSFVRDIVRDTDRVRRARLEIEETGRALPFNLHLNTFDLAPRSPQFSQGEWSSTVACHVQGDIIQDN